MANPVSGAIGTQRQFMQQPQRIYQKNLVGVNVSAGISQRQDNDAALLAQSLGVLGENVWNEEVAHEKRKEELGRAEADRMFAVTSAEDKHKLSALDILGRNDKFDLVDNPYAVARVDELRGQYLSTEYKNQYETEVLPNEPLAKTSQENAARFESFMADRMEEDGVTANNQTAFNKGFYGSRPMDLLEQDAKYRKRRQADFEAQRDASLLSKADTIVSNAIGVDNETFAAQMQQFQEDSMLTGVPISSRIKIYQAVGEKLATNGNPEQMSAWGETVAFFDNQGNEVRIKDVLPMEELKIMANKANVNMFEKKTRDFMATLEELPSSAYFDTFDNLKTSDPDFYKVIAPRFESLYKAKKKQEDKELKEAIKAQDAVYRSAAAQSALDSKYTAMMAGKDIDMAGNFTSDNKFTYLGKAATISEGEVVAWGQQQFNNNIQNYGVVEGSQRNLKLLAWDVMNPYTKQLEREMQRAFVNLSPSSLTQKEDGSLELPSSLAKSINLYNLAPDVFSGLFSESVTQNMRTLSTLVDTNGLQEGVKKFNDIRTVLADDATKQVIEKQVKDGMEMASGVPDIPVLAGNGDTDTLDFSYVGNMAVASVYRTEYMAGVASGIPDNEARAQAQKAVADTFFNYKGYALPKYFIKNIRSSAQENVSHAFLNKVCSDLAAGGDVDDVSILYNPTSRKLKLSYQGKSVEYSNRDFTIGVEKYLEELPEDKRVTIEDINNNLNLDDSDYYEQHPDAAALRKAEQQTGVSMEHPFYEVGRALLNSIEGVFN